LRSYDPEMSDLVDTELGERIIRRFVDQHGGRYDPAEPGGEHARFHLWLPAMS
jgi:signal transduction histidine kinase